MDLDLTLKDQMGVQDISEIIQVKKWLDLPGNIQSIKLLSDINIDWSVSCVQKNL